MSFGCHPASTTARDAPTAACSTSASASTAETAHDPDRLGAIYDRLDAIDAYTAPARAGGILKGLGFDDEMQARPMESFSGGWRMRVALASLLFTNPDILLLDEPSNHLDLEAVMWLEGFLRAYRGTILLISHDRHRPAGWTVPAAVYLEPGLTRVLAHVIEPETDQDYLQIKQSLSKSVRSLCMASRNLMRRASR